jgi:hypothetical protein
MLVEAGCADSGSPPAGEKSDSRKLKGVHFPAGARHMKFRHWPSVPHPFVPHGASGSLRSRTGTDLNWVSLGGMLDEIMVIRWLVHRSPTDAPGALATGNLPIVHCIRDGRHGSRSLLGGQQAPDNLVRYLGCAMLDVGITVQSA